MADGIGKGVEATKSFVKNHWIAFIVVGIAIVVVALAYDHKNAGKLTNTVAGWPIVGKLFT
jgi:uncharacterized membrane protein